MRNYYAAALLCLAMLIGFALPTPAAEKRRVEVNPRNTYQSAEHRIALVIGNSSYSSGPLKNPVNDAAAMATQLQKLGFTVILKKDANLRGMEDALADFGDRLKRGGVGLFFYAGHGLQAGGANYLVPIGARINRESDIRYETLDAGKILDEMANANNGLNIVILDACRDNPYSRSFRNAARGLAIVSNAPAGTFVSYSTGPNQVARDGEGENSPYTRALLEYMVTPGLSINNVFMKVRSKVKKETGQIPWELSSLEGDFYFVPEAAKKAADTVPAEKAIVARDESSVSTKAATDLAMAKRPSQPTTRETGRDGRFIAYDNGTVLDMKTNLMWAAKDNGSNINWANAKSYYENYRGGSYSDWRMPTQDELAGLYDSAATGKNGYKLTNLIELTRCCPWAFETRGSTAAYFNFYNGKRNWGPQSNVGDGRTLPVRSGK